MPDNPLPLPSSALTDMQHVADDLDAIKNWLDAAKPIIDDKNFDVLNDRAGYAKDFADLAVALRRDLAADRDPTLDSSHTVQELGAIELEFATDPKRLQDLATLGLISDTVARRFGYFSFGAGDVSEGLGAMAGPHHLGNVDAVEKTLDGIAATAWGIYGFLSTGDWDVAQAYAAASRITAKGVRDLTLPMVEQITAKISGLDQKIIAIWEEAQKVRAAHGQPILTIGQFYNGDASILDRIGFGELAQANARLGIPNQFERRTVENYRETCINGYCTRVDLRSNSTVPPEQPLGGVQLDKPLTGAALRGVKIDAANGNIILVAERDFLARGLNLRDFTMALWLVFGPKAQDPKFSLDPDDPHNPRGPWLRALYIPTDMEGRSFGSEMFAADLRLKELSFQAILKPNGKLEEWKSAVPGFQSYADLAMNDPRFGSGHQQWSRFWIIVHDITVRQVGNTLLFDTQMAVEAREQVPDPSSRTGLRDVDTDPASLEATWKQLATKHYDELAIESPALARVRELAVAIGIAKSLKTAGARVDLARVADLLNADHTRTTSKINAFSLALERRSDTPFREGNQEGIRTEIHELHLFGGVDLSVNPRSIPDDRGEVRGMDKAVDTAFHSARPGTGIVRFEYSGSRLEAVAVPLLVRQ